MLLEAVKPAWGQPLSSAHHALCLMCFSDTQNSLNSPLVDAIPSYIVEWPEKDTVKPQPRLPLHPTSPMTAYRTEGGTLSVLTALRNVHTVPHCPPICGFGGGGGCAPLHSLLPSMASVVFFSSTRNAFLVSIQEGLQGAVMGTTASTGGDHDTMRSNRKDRKTRYDGAH